jgi:hypothetical protein
MDLPIVPTQLAAGQGTARYCFAYQKDGRHGLMMLVAADMSSEIAVMVVVGAATTALTAISARAASVLTHYRQLGSQISMFQVCCEIGIPVRTGNSQAKFVTTSAT